MLSPKELIKLAGACRKAGIKHYKTADYEFTLTDEAPISTKSKKIANSSGNIDQQEITSDDQLTEEQILFWSSTDSQDTTVVGN